MTSSPTRQRVLGAVVWTFGGLLLVGVLAALIQMFVLVDAVRATQIEGTPTGKRIEKLAEQVQSCTTPGEECFKRNQRQTAGAVGDINDVVILAAACASGPERQSAPEIQACILAALEARKP